MKKILSLGLALAILALVFTVGDVRPTFAAKQLEIAVMVPNGVDPYFTAKRYGYEKECEKLGVKMLFYDAGGYANVHNQIGQVDDVIQRKVDGIVLGPTSAQGMIPTVDKILDMGMPLVIDNADVFTKKPAIRNMKNDYLVGLLQAVHIVEKLKGKGKVLVLPGPSTNFQCQQQQKGFTEYAQYFPGIKTITEWTASAPDVGMKTVEGILQANPDLKAIACFSPPLSVGSTKAIQASGIKKGEVIIVGQMLDAGMEDYMRNGWLQATIMSDHIDMARESVRLLVKAIKGEIKPPFYHQIRHYLITPETVDTFDRTGSTYPKEWRK